MVHAALSKWPRCRTLMTWLMQGSGSLRHCCPTPKSSGEPVKLHIHPNVIIGPSFVSTLHLILFDQPLTTTQFQSSCLILRETYLSCLLFVRCWGRFAFVICNCVTTSLGEVCGLSVQMAYASDGGPLLYFRTLLLPKTLSLSSDSLLLPGVFV